MHRTIGILRTTLSLLLFVLLLGSVVTLITSKTGVLRGIRSFTVVSGSMAPALPVGSVIYTIKQPNYSQGEIVAVQENGVTVTHRINRTLGSNADSFELKGDANKDPDSKPVAASQVVGKEFLVIPLVGKMSVLMKTPLGFLFLIILPSFVLIALEVLSIKKELEVQIEKKIKDKLGITASVVLLAVVLFMSSYATTYSFFSDTTSSTGNTFSAASSFTSTAPITDLRINEFMPHPSLGNEWIEIYNNGSASVDLTSWMITDSNAINDDLTLTGSITPGSFATFDHVDGWLNNGGDTVSLKNPSSTVVDSNTFGSSTTDKSIGRDTNGTGSFKSCTITTKGASNNGSC